MLGGLAIRITENYDITLAAGIHRPIGRFTRSMTMKRFLTGLFAFSFLAALGSAIAFEPPIAVGRKAKQKANEHEAAPEGKGAVSSDGFTYGPDKKTKYEIDPDSDRNQITFTSKAPKETIKGKANRITGFLELNPRKVNEASGKFTIEWKDVEVPNKMMDGHMKADPWVNTASHPQLVYTVTGVEESKLQAKNKKSTSFKTKLVGEMEINGKKQEMTIPVTLSYVQAKPDKPDVKEVLGIKTSFKIKLADFDIKGKPGTIGNAVAAEQDIKVSVVLARTDKPDPSESGGGSDAAPPAPKPKPKPKPKGA
jgi:polyisoprenoid-binding protein YceI